MPDNEYSDDVNLFDDVYTQYGTDNDYWLGFNSTDSRLEFLGSTGSTGPLLMEILESTGTGDGHVTGDWMVDANLGVGTTAPAAHVHVVGNQAAIRLDDDADSFPVLQVLAFAHDVCGYNMDVYWDGAAWRSSDVGSNGSWFKQSDEVQLRVNTGTTQGGTIAGWGSTSSAIRVSCANRRVRFPGFVIAGTGSIILTNTDGTINLEALEQDGASIGDGLEWNGTDWVPGAKAADAYSMMGYMDPQSISATATIATQDTWTKMILFNATGGGIGPEDSNTNVVASLANSQIAIGANGAGDYDMSATFSAEATGTPNKDFHFGIAKDYATPIAIASSTDATPVVVTTSASHGLKTGDSVIISGHVDNVIANGHHNITVTAATTFELQDFAAADVIGSGAGAGSGGAVDTLVDSTCVIHRRFPNNSDVGAAAITGAFPCVASDVVYLVALNRTDATDLDIHTMCLHLDRH